MSRVSERGPKAWVGVVSKSHVLRGVAGGFAQVCHGKRAPLLRMQRGDVLIYYSPTTEFRSGEPLRAFTAMGRIADDDTYVFDMGGGFLPFRRNVVYARGCEVRVAAIAAELRFIRDNPNWGFLARRGCFEIGLDDAERISQAMGVPTT